MENTLDQIQSFAPLNVTMTLFDVDKLEFIKRGENGVKTFLEHSTKKLLETYVDKQCSILYRSIVTSWMICKNIMNIL